MADATLKMIKDNGGIAAILALILGGGGINLVSESAEEADRDTVITEFREADFVQDAKTDIILQKINDMNLELQLMKQRMGDQ